MRPVVLRALSAAVVAAAVVAVGAALRRPAGPPSADSAAVRPWPRAAPRPAPDRADGGLVFDPLLLDLGRLDAEAGGHGAFAWRRTGEGPLRVLLVRSGCGCAAAGGLPEVVGQDDEGRLEVHVLPPRRPGPVAFDLRVLTDRPPRDLHRLRVRGFVGDEVFVDPLVADLGALAPGAAFERTLAVRPPPGGESPAPSAVLLGCEGACRVGPPADRDAVGWDVRVAGHAPGRPGPFEARVEVRWGGSAPRAARWAGRVVGPSAPGG